MTYNFQFMSRLTNHLHNFSNDFFKNVNGTLGMKHSSRIESKNLVTKGTQHFHFTRKKKLKILEV